MNHCLEVACADCGCNWCDKGCNYSPSGPNEEVKEDLQNQIENKKPLGISCMHCNGNRVYIYK